MITPREKSLVSHSSLVVLEGSIHFDLRESSQNRQVISQKRLCLLTQRVISPLVPARVLFDLSCNFVPLLRQFLVVRAKLSTGVMAGKVVAMLRALAAVVDSHIASAR